MRTIEKLERSGWQFNGKLGYHYDIYARGQERVIYEAFTDRVIGHFHLFEGNLHLIDDIEFEFLVEKV